MGESQMLEEGTPRALEVREERRQGGRYKRGMDGWMEGGRERGSFEGGREEEAGRRRQGGERDTGGGKVGGRRREEGKEEERAVEEERESMRDGGGREEGRTRVENVVEGGRGEEKDGGGMMGWGGVGTGRKPEGEPPHSLRSACAAAWPLSGPAAWRRGEEARSCRCAYADR